MNQTIPNEEPRIAKINICCPVKHRYITGVICSIAAVIEILQRSCVTVSLEVMVTQENYTYTEQRSQCPRGPKIVEYQSTTGEFNWSPERQKFLHLSFYIGYLLTHIPVGWITERRGYKWTYFASLLTSSVLTALCPITIQTFAEWGLLAINIMLGLAQGGLYPVLAVIIARWYPLNERCRWGGLLIGGNTVGWIIAEILSKYAFKDKHWSQLFYVSSVLGGLWSLIIIFFCFDVPSKHRWMSRREKAFLADNIENVLPHKEVPPVPWKLMLTSLPVWAYIAVHVGHDFVLYGMWLDMPSYLDEVLRFTREESIIWTAVPVLLLWITTLFWGFFSDYLIEKGFMDLGELRKMNTMISTFGPGLCVLFCSYARCQHFFVILFFTLCLVTTAPFFSGAKLNAIDLCPNFAGTLMGISSGLGSLGALAPSVLSVVTKKSTLAEWRNIFWLHFSIIITTAVVFILFGSSKIQKWNTGHIKSNTPSEIDQPVRV